MKKLPDYNHRAIESKWQKYWDKKKLFVAKDPKFPRLSASKKFYGLIEFPYPSNNGLHVGHIRSNTAMDIVARKRRAEGFEVLYPIGWDAFGLPTENYAIKTGIQPAVVTKKNTGIFRRQLKALGFSFDWSREINTTDPAYYKWTQWIFLKFFEKGLAYKKKMSINWCPKDKIGLANEEVIDGKCERCGTPVEKREKEQWMLAITKYADRLDRDLDPKKVLIGTRNPAKVKMIKSCFAGVSGIELISLDDISHIDDSALVEGDDFKENARRKSEFYFKKTGIPTIATDHILWVEKWPQDKGFIVHCRKLANPNSPRATDEEVIAFFKNFLATVGGQSKANFHYAISYTDSVGTIASDEIPHHYILQTEQSKTFWPGFPVESMLKDVETGVFKSEQTDDVRYAKITTVFKEKFAPRILHNHVAVDYLEKIKIQQKNWIGRSEGSQIKFEIRSTKSETKPENSNAQNPELKTKNSELKTSVEIFTTRADTLFGCTYLVLAPEHPLVVKFENQITNKDEVVRYIVQTKKKTEIERTTTEKEKTGVELKGIKAINPANGEEIPIFVADYVLADYGTGAIMAVPAHDERDFEFAKKFNLPIKQVIAPIFVKESGKDAWHPNEPETKRIAVSCFVKHWRDDTYLFLNKKGLSDSGEGVIVAVSGGVDSGEDFAGAGAREIAEETGYQNMKFIKSLGSPAIFRYFAQNGKQNRMSFLHPLLFQLVDGTQLPISEHEKSLHDIIWLSEKEIEKYLSGRPFNPFFWNKLKENDKALTSGGLLINSSQPKTKEEPCFVQTTDPGAVRKDLPFVEREAITAIVKHWSEDKYLCLKWKKVAWGTFITGGVEKGQTPEEAAHAEVLEETGYKNLILKQTLSRTNSKFFHVPKNENRFAHFHNFYFQLKDGERSVVSEDEQSKHETVWISKNEVANFLTAEGLIFSWKELVGNFDGMTSEEAKKKITEFVGGKIVTTYKLRDWVFSRQRYWGEPIPLVFCADCKKRAESADSRFRIHDSGMTEGEKLNPGWFAINEKDLPVKLPKVKNYKPTDTGESPLAVMTKWVNVKCPKCGGPARRETDTMPNWAGSSWYYLAYVMGKNLKSKILNLESSGNLFKHWLPVDWYNGGMEHTTLHLLYSRFWHKFLFDLGLVPTNEPYVKRTSHGLILAEDGTKMAKSRPETMINPDDIINMYGADTLRLYEMFMGPFDQAIAWSTESMIGPRRFLEKVWKLRERITNHESRIKNGNEKIKSNSSDKLSATSYQLQALLHRTVKKVGDDIEAMRFNTAVSALMMLVNEFEKTPEISRNQYEMLLLLLAPFAPHITEELWSLIGNKKSISIAPWPKYDKTLAVSGTKTIVIQVNGKVRADMEMEGELSEDDVKNTALNMPEIKKWIEGKQVKKIIYVKDRLVNIVV